MGVLGEHAIGETEFHVMLMNNLLQTLKSFHASTPARMLAKARRANARDHPARPQALRAPRRRFAAQLAESWKALHG